MGYWREHIFPHILDLSANSVELNELRRELLSKAQGDILEIGFGSGLNLPYYPEKTRRVVAVEPNEGMRRRARKREKASLVEVEWHHIVGEKLPFAEASFDTVISTLTLCSLHNSSAVLQEIRRVLRPSGRFLFLEHGLDPDPKGRRLQRRITPLLKHFADGCDLTLEMDKLIADNGLEIDEVRTQHVRSIGNLRPYYWLGSARKSGPTESGTA